MYQLEHETACMTMKHKNHQHSSTAVVAIPLVLAVPLQPSTVTSFSVKPDDVRYRTRNFAGKIHGTQPTSNIMFRG